MDSILKTILSPISEILSSGERVYWFYLLTAVVLAFWIYLIENLRRRDLTVVGFLKYCFPKAIFWHRSSRDDYLYFYVNKILYTAYILPLVLSVEGAADQFSALLTNLIGTAPNWSAGGIGLSVAYTLLMVLAMDFGIFVAHYFQHRIPLLWEFHKVHHSAQVLNPMTVYRQHPVDDFLSMTFSALFMGVFQGIFQYFWPSGLRAVVFMNINIVLFLFYVFGYNLRHSHIWLSYGPILSRIIISPAQHQIHHSNLRQHFDKNYGFIFAIWDWLFGSLYVPKRKEEFSLGLYKEEHIEYTGIFRLYFLPFVKAWKLIF